MPLSLCNLIEAPGHSHFHCAGQGNLLSLSLVILIKEKYHMDLAIAGSLELREPSFLDFRDPSHRMVKKQLFT